MMTCPYCGSQTETSPCQLCLRTFDVVAAGGQPEGPYPPPSYGQQSYTAPQQGAQPGYPQQNYSQQAYPYPQQYNWPQQSYPQGYGAPQGVQNWYQSGQQHAQMQPQRRVLHPQAGPWPLFTAMALLCAPGCLFCGPFFYSRVFAALPKVAGGAASIQALSWTNIALGIPFLAAAAILLFVCAASCHASPQRARTLFILGAVFSAVGNFVYLYTILTLTERARVDGFRLAAGTPYGMVMAIAAVLILLLCVGGAVGMHLLGKKSNELYARGM